MCKTFSIHCQHRLSFTFDMRNSSRRIALIQDHAIAANTIGRIEYTELAKDQYKILF
jgi:hypothetical protein